jgi:quinol monooxygenase YgiN
MPGVVHESEGSAMIFIVVKFPVRADKVDEWVSATDTFTRAVRDEPGNVFFEWSRSLDDPLEFVLLEAFASDDAGKDHVESDHFRAFVAAGPDLVSRTPSIINVTIPGDGWSEMGEIKPSGA